MSDDNGFKPIEIDVTNEHEFKTGVVKYLQLVVDQNREILSMKKKVEKHEQIYQAGKWASIPVLALLHAFFKTVFHRLGW